MTYLRLRLRAAFEYHNPPDDPISLGHTSSELRRWNLGPCQHSLYSLATRRQRPMLRTGLGSYMNLRSSVRYAYLRTVTYALSRIGTTPSLCDDTGTTVPCSRPCGFTHNPVPSVPVQPRRISLNYVLNIIDESM